MKRIEKDELYQNLKEFLKVKGVELTEGSYSQGIHKTCSMLADVINLSQQGLERAKNGVDRKLDQVRQVIHEKTAPKAPTPEPPPTGTPPADEPPSAGPAPAGESPEAAVVAPATPPSEPPPAVKPKPRRAAAKKKAATPAAPEAKKTPRRTKGA